MEYIIFTCLQEGALMQYESMIRKTPGSKMSPGIFESLGENIFFYVLGTYTVYVRLLLMA